MSIIAMIAGKANVEAALTSFSNGPGRPLSATTTGVIVSTGISGALSFIMHEPDLHSKPGRQSMLFVHSGLWIDTQAPMLHSYPGPQSSLEAQCSTSILAHLWFPHRNPAWQSESEQHV